MATPTYSAATRSVRGHNSQAPRPPPPPRAAAASHGRRCNAGLRGALLTLCRSRASLRLRRTSEAAKNATYIICNRRRMRYPQFHEQGLCTSTGVLEAGCKVVIAPNSADGLSTSGNDGQLGRLLPPDSTLKLGVHSIEAGYPAISYSPGPAASHPTTRDCFQASTPKPDPTRPWPWRTNRAPALRPTPPSASRAAPALHRRE